MRYVLMIILLSLASFASLPADSNDTVPITSFAGVTDATAIANVKPVKNVILVIGDGMGFEAVTAARIHAYGRGTGLALDRMPVTGQSLCYSLDDNFITDSAASGTALASGVKTLNGRIGEDADARPLRTIVDVARGLGKSTGVVAACDVTHATPAAFASHVKNRSNAWEIARQISREPLDVLLGGGYGYFLPGSHEESLRDDELDLLQDMRDRGTTVVTSVEELSALDLGRVERLAGLFTIGHLERRGVRGMDVDKMTETALEILGRNPKGFFLMVEASQIDWAGHGNDLEYSVGETLDLDATVARLMEFAEQDGETLVIVTADHETGGLSLNSTSESRASLTAGWTTGSHTANVVPLFACGPNAGAFGRVVQNHNIPQLAVQGWGVRNFSSFAYDR